MVVAGLLTADRLVDALRGRKSDDEGSGSAIVQYAIIECLRVQSDRMSHTVIIVSNKLSFDFCAYNFPVSNSSL